MQSIGDRIRVLRKAKGWTQDDLAEATNIHRVTIAQYESGKVIPKSTSLKRLADALEVDAGYLLGDDDEMSNDDRELWELREALRRDPDRRALLQLAQHGTAQDVRQVAALIDALRATNPDFYDGDDPA